MGPGVVLPRPLARRGRRPRRARPHHDKGHVDRRDLPHRPGALRVLPFRQRDRGTMPLDDLRRGAALGRAIKEEVLTRRMPKWHAARGYGDFSNDPSLSPFEIALIAAWADGGAPRGTEADARRPRRGDDPREKPRACRRVHATSRSRAASRPRRKERCSPSGPCSTKAGPSASRSGFQMAGGRSWGGYATSSRSPRPPTGCGVPLVLPPGAIVSASAGGGIVQPHAHASGTVTTKDAVTTCPRR